MPTQTEVNEWKIRVLEAREELRVERENGERKLRAKSDEIDAVQSALDAANAFKEDGETARRRLATVEASCADLRHELIVAQKERDAAVQRVETTKRAGASTLMEAKAESAKKQAELDEANEETRKQAEVARRACEELAATRVEMTAMRGEVEEARAARAAREAADAADAARAADATEASAADADAATDAAMNEMLRADLAEETRARENLRGELARTKEKLAAAERSAESMTRRLEDARAETERAREAADDAARAAAAASARTPPPVAAVFNPRVSSPRSPPAPDAGALAAELEAALDATTRELNEANARASRLERRVAAAEAAAAVAGAAAGAAAEEAEKAAREMRSLEVARAREALEEEAEAEEEAEEAEEARRRAPGVAWEVSARGSAGSPGGATSPEERSSARETTNADSAAAADLRAAGGAILPSLLSAAGVDVNRHQRHVERFRPSPMSAKGKGADANRRGDSGDGSDGGGGGGGGGEPTNALRDRIRRGELASPPSSVDVPLSAPSDVFPRGLRRVNAVKGNAAHDSEVDAVAAAAVAAAAAAELEAIAAPPEPWRPDREWISPSASPMKTRVDDEETRRRKAAVADAAARARSPWRRRGPGPGSPRQLATTDDRSRSRSRSRSIVLARGVGVRAADADDDASYAEQTREATALATSLARQSELLEKLRLSRERRRTELDDVRHALDELTGYVD